MLCAGTLLLYSPIVEDSSYWPAIGLGTAIASLCLVAFLRAFGFAWQSAPIAYIAFLWMFHFPMTLFVHLVPDLQAQLPDPLSGWIQHASWYRASIYSSAVRRRFRRRVRTGVTNQTVAGPAGI